MDNKFTEQIKQWLETPEVNRDNTVGVFLYLLRGAPHRNRPHQSRRSMRFCTNPDN